MTDDIRGGFPLLPPDADVPEADRRQASLRVVSLAVVSVLKVPLDRARVASDRFESSDDGRDVTLEAEPRFFAYRKGSWVLLWALEVTVIDVGYTLWMLDGVKCEVDKDGNGGGPARSLLFLIVGAA